MALISETHVYTSLHNHACVGLYRTKNNWQKRPAEKMQQSGQLRPETESAVHSAGASTSTAGGMEAWNLAMKSVAFLSTSRSPMYHRPSSSLGRTFLDDRRGCSYSGSSAPRYPPDPKQDMLAPIACRRLLYFLARGRSKACLDSLLLLICCVHQLLTS
jgi:hypothetical protein